MFQDGKLAGKDQGARSQMAAKGSALVVAQGDVGMDHGLAVLHRNIADQGQNFQGPGQVQEIILAFRLVIVTYPGLADGTDGRYLTQGDAVFLGQALQGRQQVVALGQPPDNFAAGGYGDIYGASPCI
jgi:hypothetical protein